ncbi:MAG: DUF6428 family protein [Gemmataceae bacterium]
MTLDSLLAVLAAHTDAGIHLMLPDRSFVPAHFHITEVGRVQKDFIDCGGTVRTATSCVLQVWVAQDLDHRLDTTKLLKILRLASPLLQATDLPVEVEYEDRAVSQYPVEMVEVTPSGLLVHLGSKHTTCLAQDRCGVGSGTASGCDAPGCCEADTLVLPLGAPA